MSDMKKCLTDTDILIIGAGASGLAAACAAASAGVSVIAVDGNDRPGRKLSATGNGRCNLTNTQCTPADYNREASEFVEHVFRRFDPKDTLRAFRKEGLLIREEQEGRCYPYSGQASVVTNLLIQKARSTGARFELGDAVISCSANHGIYYTEFASGAVLKSRCLIIATGGRAGLHFGSTGDGYGFAKSFGHTLRAPRPALVACESDDPFLSGLKGRARAQVTLTENGQDLYTEYGEVQFTGSGLSGICVMNLTRYMDAARPAPKKKNKSRAGNLEKSERKFQELPHEYVIRIDFVPEYTEQEIASLLQCSVQNVSMQEALSRIVNERIAAAVSGVAEDSVKKAAELLKSFQVRINYTKGWGDAQVTRGGIRLDELDPDTMQSRLVPGLFFCGEVADVDGPCGGYNLQWAWSSGYLGGISAAEYVKKCSE